MPRIVGKQGSLLLNIASSWNYVADLFDWELSYELATLDVSIKGDSAQRLEVSHGQGRLSAKRYVELAGTFVFGDLITSGLRYDFAVVSLDTVPPSPTGFTGNTSAKVQGTGYFVRARMAAPRGMVSDDMEMALDTLPVIT